MTSEEIKSELRAQASRVLNTELGQDLKSNSLVFNDNLYGFSLEVENQISIMDNGVRVDLRPGTRISFDIYGTMIGY